MLFFSSLYLHLLHCSSLFFVSRLLSPMWLFVMDFFSFESLDRRLFGLFSPMPALSQDDQTDSTGSLVFNGGPRSESQNHGTAVGGSTRPSSNTDQPLSGMLASPAPPAPIAQTQEDGTSLQAHVPAPSAASTPQPCNPNRYKRPSAQISEPAFHAPTAKRPNGSSAPGKDPLEHLKPPITELYQARGLTLEQVKKFMELVYDLSARYGSDVSSSVKEDS